MRIGINLDPFLYRGSAEAGFARMKELGYDTADVSLSDTNAPWYSDEALMLTHCSEIKAAAEKTGIEIFQVHGPWPTDDTSEEKREIVWDYMKRAVYGCHCLGCKNLVIHPQMPNGWGPEKIEGEQEILTVSMLNWLMPECEKYDVTICLENMPTLSHSIATTETIVKVVKQVKSVNIAICLDTGHSNVCQENLGDAVRTAAPYLRVLHIHDNSGRDQHQLPFFGTANWKDFTDALAEVGYKGSLSLETSGFVNRSQPLELRELGEIMTAATIKYLAKAVVNAGK